MQPPNRPIAVAFLGLLAQACQGHTPPDETGSLLPVASRIEQVACEHRAGCHAARLMRSAGKSASGDELAVIVVRLAKTDCGACTPFETWLVSSGPGSVKRVRRLSKKCSTTFDAPSIEVIGPNRVRYVEEEVHHTTLEYGLLDVIETYDIALDPLRLLRQTDRRKPQQGDGVETTVGPRDSWEQCIFQGDGPCERLAHRLPRLEVVDDGAFAQGGWKTTSLGDCAMVLDGASFGELSDASSGSSGTASVRALLSGDTLYVEVRDGKFVTQGHVLDWLTIHLAWTDSLDVLDWKMNMDGALFWATPRGEKRSSRSVDVAVVDSQTRRFRLPTILAPLDNASRLVYENTDDGRTVRQRLVSAANSTPIQSIPRERARCIPRDGVLQLERTNPGREGDAAPSDPDTPLLP